MRIYTTYGDVPFKLFTFPDGQPHFSLDVKETRPEGMNATIEVAIISPNVLLQVLLAKDALTASGYRVALDIRYLLGARMDRRINYSQPATLQVIANLIMAAGFTRIRVLDPHSSVALDLLGAEPVYPFGVVSHILSGYSTTDTVVIAPDKGATERVKLLMKHIPYRVSRIVQAVKCRDSQTGALTGFAVEDATAVIGKHCVILDDICDGGGTFVGLADVLNNHGAKDVDLFVTHGLFTKGLPLHGIRKIYTTDSISNYIQENSSDFVTFQVSMADME